MGIFLKVFGFEIDCDDIEIGLDECLVVLFPLCELAHATGAGAGPEGDEAGFAV